MSKLHSVYFFLFSVLHKEVKKLSCHKHVSSKPTQIKNRTLRLCKCWTLNNKSISLRFFQRDDSNFIPINQHIISKNKLLIIHKEYLLPFKEVFQGNVFFCSL